MTLQLDASHTAVGPAGVLTRCSIWSTVFSNPLMEPSSCKASSHSCLVYTGLHAQQQHCGLPALLLICQWRCVAVWLRMHRVQGISTYLLRLWASASVSPATATMAAAPTAPNVVAYGLPLFAMRTQGPQRQIGGMSSVKAVC